MEENWKEVEDSVNQKEVESRVALSSVVPIDLPPELQSYITETITNDVELTNEESALVDLRLHNVNTAARSFHKYDKELSALKEAKLQFEQKFLITSGKNRPPQVIEAMKKINAEIAEVEQSILDLSQSNPEAYIVRNALELRNYRKQLRFEGFVLTPYAEKKLQELEDNYYAVDKIPFLNGETGSGKSSVAKYFCSEVLGTEPERIAGAKGIDETKIFGKIDLTSDEKGPQAVFVPGPLYRAMENGVPLIIEEVNAIPPEILKSLNDVIINAKKGEEVAVIGDPKGSKIKAKPGFGIIMTGNLNRNPKAIDRYKGLFELSADFVNRIRPIDYDYLPQATEGNYIEEASRGNELYTLMVAMIMNDKGDVNAPEGAFDDLWRLAKFTRKVQEVYSGQRDGKLFSGQAGLNVPVTATSSVISMRDVKQVIEAWKRDNFEKEVDYYVYKELIAPLTNAMDIKFFVQQLQAEGFFANDSWKAVIAKAGTFDSALHAPENNGKDLEFTTVREVVEAVYGKAPERTEFPYDLQAVKKNEERLNKLEKKVAEIKHCIDSGISEDLKSSLSPILDTGLESLSKMKELSAILKTSIEKKESSKIIEVSSQLDKIDTELSDGAFGKVAKELLGPTSKLMSVIKNIESTIEKESSLPQTLEKIYTDKFIFDQEFLAYHQKYLENLKELFPPSKIEALKTTSKKVNELRIKRALGQGGLDTDIALAASEDIKAIVEVNPQGRPFKELDDDTVYPNWSDSKITVGAQNWRTNPDIDKTLHNNKVTISMETGMEDIFSNSEDFFKEKKHVALNRFYKKGWSEGNPLPLLETSVTELNSWLSGFIYSEPWMIKAWIDIEEDWRQNEAVKESFSKMYVHPVTFCIKLKNGNNCFVEVERTSDFQWKIKHVKTAMGTGKFFVSQFIAPQIAPGF